MAPTTRSSTHPRTAPPPQQITFPRRRKTVRPRDSPPPLKKRQSTLTQLDYVQTPHSTARRPEPISISSDEDEDEYEEGKSKKRKRKTSSGVQNTKQAKRDPKQSTLTQKWDMSAILEIKDSDESDDELSIHEDQSAYEVPVSSVRQAIPDSETESEVEQRLARSGKRTFAVSSDAENQSTRPTTACSTDPRTPKKITRTCIPSSNTPASMILSVHSARSQRSALRSPLKERSVNISPSKRSLILSGGKAKLATSPAKATPVEGFNQENGTDPASGVWTATLAFTPKKQRQPQKRTLVRTTTVQDSDEDDMDLDDLPVIAQETPAIPMRPLVAGSVADTPRGESTSVTPKQAHQPPSTSTQQESQMPEWKRTGVVQDSEESSLGLTCSSPATQTQDQTPAEGSTFSTSSQMAPAHQDLLGDHIGIEKTAPSPELEQIHELPEEHYPPKSQRQAELNNTGNNHQDDEIDQHAREARSTQPSKANAGDTLGDLDLPSDPPEAAIIEIDDGADEQHADFDDELTANDDEYDEDYDLDQQYTYDPVQDALERDEARFGKTDTQLDAEKLYTQFVPFGQHGGDSQLDGIAEEGEEKAMEHAEDPAQLTAADQEQQEVEFVPSSQPAERSMRQEQNGDVDDSGYCSQHSDKVPSSQPLEMDLPEPATQTKPPLRPSQISTVVGSQDINSRPNSAHDNLHLWSDENSLPQPPISSSPFPVPPGFSQMKFTGEESQFTLTDFSLPLPPPLFSSER